MEPTSLAERIAARRRELGLTQTDLASIAGVSKAAVSYWETGDTKNLKNEHLFAIADALRVEARWLAVGQGPKELRVRRVAGLRGLAILALIGSLLGAPQTAESVSPLGSVYYVKWRRLLRNILFPFFRVSIS